MSRETARDPVRRNPPGWTPPGLWAPLSGHLTVALLKAPIVVVASQALMLVPAWGPGPLDRTIGAVTLMTLVFCTVEVVVERPFVVRGRLMAPGGWGFAVLPWLAGSMAAAATVILWLGAPTGVVLASVMSGVEAAFVLWSRAWRPGDTDAEYHEKWVKTKEMTKEMFAPDVAEIRRRLDERAMDGYRRKIAERDAQRELDEPDEERERDEGDRPARDA
ncbi:hypothetical protein DZF92_05800 [Clavibacter michiganensis subsp. insidiosus]|uniref:Uncharacterized protein n=1 Tax=Clavibacter michiganensis subsp. insidiosus TaxID=33014 RepID=A0A399N2C3_9MICO|nr:hypothetical protein BEH62_02780 [Clavibacter michiganensis subsp. insidiosus]OQJ60864.1 hypothetical protein B5P21_13760 [Clavibacter michiganensis subsp. insidiosus]RII87737.1 hypothetical protein DZF92_05800 [Clavibacter michiganensis subsp. insidiosus]RIJ44629.1 hypothetical protein DZF93_02080 [Clavibacter michiganensis subsp. insidiosus]RMC84158.1 hypothetical protein CmiCFBP2404_12715 [Clavibacter michiganensis subsp. insidiosus]